MLIFLLNDNVANIVVILNILYLRGLDIDQFKRTNENHEGLMSYGISTT